MKIKFSLKKSLQVASHLQWLCKYIKHRRQDPNKILISFVLRPFSFFLFSSFFISFLYCYTNIILFKNFVIYTKNFDLLIFLKKLKKINFNVLKKKKKKRKIIFLSIKNYFSFFLRSLPKKKSIGRPKKKKLFLKWFFFWKYDDFTETLIFSWWLNKNLHIFYSYLKNFHDMKKYINIKNCDLVVNKLILFINNYKNNYLVEWLNQKVNFSVKNIFLKYLFLKDFFILYEFSLIYFVNSLNITYKFLDVPLFDKITETDKNLGFELKKLVEFYFFSNIFEKIFEKKPVIWLDKIYKKYDFYKIFKLKHFKFKINKNINFEFKKTSLNRSFFKFFKKTNLNKNIFYQNQIILTKNNYYNSFLLYYFTSKELLYWLDIDKIISKKNLNNTLNFKIQYFFLLDYFFISNADWLKFQEKIYTKYKFLFDWSLFILFFFYGKFDSSTILKKFNVFKCEKTLNIQNNNFEYLEKYMELFIDFNNIFKIHLYENLEFDDNLLVLLNNIFNYIKFINSKKNLDNFFQILNVFFYFKKHFFLEYKNSKLLIENNFYLEELINSSFFYEIDNLFIFDYTNNTEINYLNFFFNDIKNSWNVNLEEEDFSVEEESNYDTIDYRMLLDNYENNLVTKFEWLSLLELDLENINSNITYSEYHYDFLFSERDSIFYFEILNKIDQLNYLEFWEFNLFYYNYNFKYVTSKKYFLKYYFYKSSILKNIFSSMHNNFKENNYFILEDSKIPEIYFNLNFINTPNYTSFWFYFPYSSNFESSFFYYSCFYLIFSSKIIFMELDFSVRKIFNNDLIFQNLIDVGLNDYFYTDEINIDTEKIEIWEELDEQTLNFEELNINNSYKLSLYENDSKLTNIFSKSITSKNFLLFKFFIYFLLFSKNSKHI